MAVAFDAASNPVIWLTGSKAWTHTPVGTPKAVIVLYVAENDTDDATSITYGSLTLTQITGSPNTKLTEETGQVACFFAGSGIPTGAQTVTVNTAGDNETKGAVCITLTADTDTEIVDSDLTINSDSVTDPTAVLSLAGRTCFACIGCCSGAASEAGIAPRTGWTTRREDDYGVQAAGWYTYDTIGTTDVTAGWLQTTEDAIAIALAVSEVVAGGLSIPVAMRSYRTRRINS